MCRNVVGGDYWGVYKRGGGRAEMDRPLIQAVHSNPLTDVNIALHQHHTLITKKTKLSSYIGKFRWDRVQSRIWGRAQISIYEEAVSQIWLYTRSGFPRENFCLSVYCVYVLFSIFRNTQIDAETNWKESRSASGVKISELDRSGSTTAVYKDVKC